MLSSTWEIPINQELIFIAPLPHSLLMRLGEFLAVEILDL